MDSAGMARRVREGMTWSLHATDRATTNDLDPVGVESAMRVLVEVIEDYPNDPRGASCLVLAWTEEGRPIHVVIGYGWNRLRAITVYRPDLRPELWSADFRARKQA